MDERDKQVSEQPSRCGMRCGYLDHKPADNEPAGLVQGQRGRRGRSRGQWVDRHPHSESSNTKAEARER